MNRKNTDFISLALPMVRHAFAIANNQNKNLIIYYLLEQTKWNSVNLFRKEIIDYVIKSINKIQKKL